MLEGKVLYREVWDHKPPGVYLINALGLTVGKGSLWGVWALEVVSLAVAALLSVTVLSRVYGLLIGTAVTISWMLALPHLSPGGNFTEEYLLPLQFAALWVFVSAEERGWRPYHGVMLGIMAGAAMLLKLNVLGIWAAVLFYKLVVMANRNRWREIFRLFWTVAIGTGMVLGAATVWLYSSGAFADFVDAVFRYNAEYSRSASLYARVHSLFYGFTLEGTAGLFVLGLAGWLLSLYLVVQARGRLDRFDPMTIIAFVGLPIEMLMLSISGRDYPHYWLVALPLMATSAAVFFHGLRGGFYITQNKESAASTLAHLQTRNFVIVATVSLLLAANVEPTGLFLTKYVRGDFVSVETEVVKYVVGNTKKDDLVLLWGAEPGINFLTSRASPTRFSYLYPLLTTGYQSEHLVNQFLCQLSSNPPAMIIDTSPTNLLIPPLSERQRGIWHSPDSGYAPLPEMASVYNFIATNYELASSTPESMPWPVYKLREGSHSQEFQGNGQLQPCAR
ncbi:MAG: hypothetical protein Q7K03_04000 [Dehalococcoidia bacterium]|nr:hypothetical protein [Dehalococcoidia bacterium]